ncbi:MAG: HU family DNA-binding protein [Bacteroidales bacterium]|jgi:DNA-binding protein HU-beta|nr:HU family DNA-binding protein [Bacteroidales bacterium]
MSKLDLINAMAEKTGSTKAEAKKALEAFLEIATETLKKGENVSLIGFGTFSVQKRAARKGHNPQTKKEILIPTKKVVKFKPGQGLAL